jgi:hypothetical protein
VLSSFNKLLPRESLPACDDVRILEYRTQVIQMTSPMILCASKVGCLSGVADRCGLQSQSTQKKAIVKYY